MGEPELSVVIACVSGVASATRCLSSLESQADSGSFEVIVVDRCGASTRAALRARFPRVSVIAAAEGASIPQLRWQGIERARGRAVAVLGDRYSAGPGWGQTALRLHREGRRAAGGPVEAAPLHGSVARAAYLCEYAALMPPLQEPATRLAGGNAVYERELLRQIGAAGHPPWDTMLHERIRAHGVTACADPGLTVTYEREWRFAEFVRHRYHFGRALAAERSHAWGRCRRLGMVAVTPLLPALLIARSAAQVVRKRRRVREFVVAAPLLAVFFAAGALGETLGVLGGPGDSPQRVD